MSTSGGCHIYVAKVDLDKFYLELLTEQACFNTSMSTFVLPVLSIDHVRIAMSTSFLAITQWLSTVPLVKCSASGHSDVQQWMRKEWLKNVEMDWLDDFLGVDSQLLQCHARTPNAVSLN